MPHPPPQELQPDHGEHFPLPQLDTAVDPSLPHPKASLRQWDVHGRWPIFWQLSLTCCDNMMPRTFAGYYKWTFTLYYLLPSLDDCCFPNGVHQALVFALAWPYACVSVTLNRCIVYQSVADLGQEPGGPGSPYFEPTLRPKGRKKNFWDPPPLLPEGLNTPPWSMGAAVVKALASHQCGRGSNPGVDAICGLSLLLVLSLAPRGFSPGTPVFPSPKKPTFPNSNSTRNQVDEEPPSGCATCKSLFIYFYLFIYWFFSWSCIPLFGENWCSSALDFKELRRQTDFINSVDKAKIYASHPRGYYANFY